MAGRGRVSSSLTATFGPNRLKSDAARAACHAPNASDSRRASRSASSLLLRAWRSKSATASRMFATNFVNLVRMLDRDGETFVDPDDEVLAGMLVVAGGEVVHPVVRETQAQQSSPSGTRTP